MEMNALGLIEVVGYPAAVEAADVCLKSANVRLIGYELATDGLVTVKVAGDVGAVRAAVDAGSIKASQLGKVLSVLVIPRPAKGVGGLICSRDTVRADGHAANCCGTHPEPQAEGQEQAGEQQTGTPDAILAETAEAKAAEAPEPAEAEVEVEAEEESATAVPATADPEEPAAVEPPEPVAVDAAEAAPAETLEAAPAETPEGQPAEPESAAAERPMSKAYTCNLCRDPLCTRLKGQPSYMCLHAPSKK